MRTPAKVRARAARGPRRARLVFALLLGASAAGPAAAETAGIYGALAISTGSGAYGFSYNYNSDDEARRRAMAECVKRTQAGDCKVAATFSRNCIAVAYSANKVFGWATGYPNDERPERALNACASANGNACKIVQRICSGQ